jgi:predicted nucleic acid-binding protein
MRFWDASALVPLVYQERMTPAIHEAYERDPRQTVWCMTPVEVWSAVARRRRASEIGSPQIREARHRLEALAAGWVEVEDIRAVRRRAQRLLDLHPLRAADALQLAAALVFVADRPEGFEFVTLDSRLAEAAESEAFRVVVPT